MNFVNENLCLRALSVPNCLEHSRSHVPVHLFTFMSRQTCVGFARSFVAVLVAQLLQVNTALARESW